MKRVWLMVLLACGGLWCAQVYGYLPEMDDATGLCTFKRELQIGGLTGAGSVDGSIGLTDEMGNTSISFSWRHPETKWVRSACWSGRVWRDRFGPFFSGDYMYDVQLSNDGSTLEIRIDGSLVLTGTLSERRGTYSTPHAWDVARILKGSVIGASGVLGIFELKCGRAGKNGTAKVSATLTRADGTKKTFKAQEARVSNGVTEVTWPLDDSEELRVTIDERSFRGTGGGMSVQTAVVGGISSWSELLFTVENVSLAVPDGYTLLDVNSLFGWGGGELVHVNRMNGTWKCGKAMSPHYVKYRKGMTPPVCCSVKSGESYLNVMCECNGENRIGLMLHNNPTKGVFKGSFCLYAIRSDGKRGYKKYRANVTGVVVDGEGHGQAKCKRPAGGPWAVTVR